MTQHEKLALIRQLREHWQQSVKLLGKWQDVASDGERAAVSGLYDAYAKVFEAVVPLLMELNRNAPRS
jgi:hypothetical protein